MARVLVIDARDGVARRLVSELRASGEVEAVESAPQQDDGYAGHLSGGYDALVEDLRADTVVYSPPRASRRVMTPDLEDAAAVFNACARGRVTRLVLISSALVYGASPHNQGLLGEARTPASGEKTKLARAWRELEALAASYIEASWNGVATLTVLRPAAVLVPGGDDYFSRLLSGRVAFTLPGHDPTLQLLSPADLARAVRCAVETDAPGVYNVAPRGAIPLRAALRATGAKRVPLSRTLQRVARAALTRAGLAHPSEQLDYVRYSWTVSDSKARRALGYEPRASSAEALAEFAEASGRVTSTSTPSATPSRDFDDFGMDKEYIAAFGRTLFRFLHDRYWRVEYRGLENVPREGRAVMVGFHRGFMPWDGVMALHLLVRELGRYPRFLIHPGLIKFPFLFNYMTKLGGIVACQENASRVLERDEPLGIFPEGIRGAFTQYRDAYRLGKFGRDEFVRFALRHQAPIVPFVTVGSAETYPILKRLDWGWWKRRTEWPCLPLTPTFPLLPPVPLPSKWHTEFLDPVAVAGRYPPEAADHPETVRAISREVRSRMQAAIDSMLARRKSLFRGSVFDEENAGAPQLSGAPAYEEPVGYREGLIR